MKRENHGTIYRNKLSLCTYDGLFDCIGRGGKESPKLELILLWLVLFFVVATVFGFGFTISRGLVCEESEDDEENKGCFE